MSKAKLINQSDDTGKTVTEKKRSESTFLVTDVEDYEENNERENIKK
jgi:hypothetical protein